MKRLAAAAIFCLVIAATLALLAWQFVRHRIARDERSPHLTRIHEAAADFQFRTLDGRVEHLSATRGKVVFVDLWGTWCIQCVAEMPTVQKLYDRYRNDPDVTFLIISRMDTPAAVRRYALLHHYDLPFYTTDDDDIPRSMQLGQFPATFLYAHDGSIAAKHTGAADWSTPEVAAFLDGLRAQRAGGPSAANAAVP